MLVHCACAYPLVLLTTSCLLRSPHWILETENLPLQRKWRRMRRRQLRLARTCLKLELSFIRLFICHCRRMQSKTDSLCCVLTGAVVVFCRRPPSACVSVHPHPSVARLCTPVGEASRQPVWAHQCTTHVPRLYLDAHVSRVGRLCHSCCSFLSVGLHTDHLPGSTPYKLLGGYLFVCLKGAAKLKS